MTEAIKSSRQRWELIANEREATFMRELAVSRAQTLKLQEIEKDMEFVCRSERELSNVSGDDFESLAGRIVDAFDCCALQRAYVSLKKVIICAHEWHGRQTVCETNLSLLANCSPCQLSGRLWRRR